MCGQNRSRLLAGSDRFNLRSHTARFACGRVCPRQVVANLGLVPASKASRKGSVTSLRDEFSGLAALLPLCFFRGKFLAPRRWLRKMLLVFTSFCSVPTTFSRPHRALRLKNCALFVMWDRSQVQERSLLVSFRPAGIDLSAFSRHSLHVLLTRLCVQDLPTLFLHLLLLLFWSQARAHQFLACVSLALVLEDARPQRIRSQCKQCGRKRTKHPVFSMPQNQELRWACISLQRQ